LCNRNFPPAEAVYAHVPKTKVKGTWGKRGATSVHLKVAKKGTLAKAIQAAWRNTAPKRLLKL
jgi:hypothetical protein